MKGGCRSASRDRSAVAPGRGLRTAARDAAGGVKRIRGTRTHATTLRQKGAGLQRTACSPRVPC
eukprot:760566-Prymnesium_polylepis.1